MIIDFSLLNSTSPEVRKAIDDFHYGLGSYYDITVIPADNSKIVGTSFADLITSGDGSLIVVNRSGFRYRENRDIRNVIAYTLEKNEGLSIVKKSSPNYDLFLFTFEEGIDAELNKPKKNLIKRRKKETEIETPNPVTPEPIIVKFDGDPYEEEPLEK
jgi:hypothetical protein